MIARQEAFEKAANEEVVLDQTPRPIPPEVTGTLAPVAEGDEVEGELRQRNTMLKNLESLLIEECDIKTSLLPIFIR